MRARPRVLLTVLLSLLLQGCGGETTDIGPVIADNDRAYGKQVHPQLLAEFGGENAGDETAYVRSVGERIAAAAGLGDQCHFTLVNSDVVNAFAVPGCYIYLTRGLFAIVTSEAELASVLGHEVGHIVAQHAQRQQRRTIWRTIGVIAVSFTGSERLTRLASQAGQFFGLRYSRKQEYEADDLGIRYLQEAGYDVFAAADMLAALQRQDEFISLVRGGGSARRLPEWALSHPLTESRIGRARDTAASTGLKDDELPEKAAQYLASVDGLLFGDDPAQGFVLGRRFAHPGMGITFDAPTGFSLTNSPQAIRLSAASGVSGEFAGGALQGRDLAAYSQALLASVVGDAPTTVSGMSSTTINGVPAIITNVQVAVRDGSVPLALAVYDGGHGQVFHFVVIYPSADPEALAVSLLFRSFRKLSANEAAALRPRFVRTIKATASDTYATLASRVADPAPTALFNLLNGRDRDEPIKPGETVKVVTYEDAR